MHNKLKKILTLSIVAAALSLIFPGFAYASEIESDITPAPIILDATKIEEDSGVFVKTNGIIKNGYQVLIYINGTYQGLANISKITNIYSKFSFLSAETYEKYNNLELMAIARNEADRRLSSPEIISVNSLIKKSVITAPATTSPKKNFSETLLPKQEFLPAPKLYAFNKDSCVSLLTLSGETINNSSLAFYVDEQPVGEISINAPDLETVKFNFSPNVVFSRGNHYAFAVAKKGQNATSQKSNLINFCIYSPVITAAATTTKNNQESQNLTISSSTDDLIFQNTERDFPNKNNNFFNNSTVKTILFIIFVLIIVFWMVMVNKDLLNEQVEKNDPDKKN